MKRILAMLVILIPAAAMAQDNVSGMQFEEIESMLTHIKQLITAESDASKVLYDNLSRKIDSSRKDSDNLSKKIDGTKKDLTALSQKIDQINTETKRRKALAADSYNKAMRLTREKQYQTAGIYFGNALALDPDNLSILNSYTDAVIEWVNSRQAQGDYDSAQDTLNDYIRYLYTFPAGLNLDGADYLSATYWKLTEYQQKLAMEASNKKTQVSSLAKSDLEKTIRAQLSAPVPATENELKDEFRQLQLYSTQWQRVAPGDVQLHDLISNRITKIADNIEALELLNYGEDNIRRSREGSGVSAYYISSELYITSQRLLNLKPSLTPAIAARVDKFTNDIENLSGTMTADSAKATWDRLSKRKLEVMANANKASTVEETIRLWGDFADEVSIEIPRLANSTYKDRIRSLLAETNQRLASSREAQLKEYEKWSIKNISTMYNLYQGEIGMLSGGKSTKEKVAGGLKEYLCPIDTRYLSLTGMKIYNDIFDYFNKELDREMRINLAVQFNECKRRPLADF